MKLDLSGEDLENDGVPVFNLDKFINSIKAPELDEITLTYTQWGYLEQILGPRNGEANIGTIKVNRVNSYVR